MADTDSDGEDWNAPGRFVRGTNRNANGVMLSHSDRKAGQGGTDGGGGDAAGSATKAAAADDGAGREKEMGGGDKVLQDVWSWLEPVREVVLYRPDEVICIGARENVYRDFRHRWSCFALVYCCLHVLSMFRKDGTEFCIIFTACHIARAKFTGSLLLPLLYR